jgi:hypothetical protein
MKFIILITFSVFGLGMMAHAQGLRHVQGINLIGASYGIAPGSGGTTNFFGIGYSKYLRKNWILNITGLYETGNIETTDVKNYLVNAGVDYTLFKTGNFLYFNAGLSVLAGGETIGNSENPQKKNSFVCGPSGNLNFEVYLTDRFVMQVKAEQNYLPGSKLGNWYPAFHIGLKYCIF